MGFMVSQRSLHAVTLPLVIQENSQPGSRHQADGTPGWSPGAASVSSGFSGII